MSLFVGMVCGDSIVGLWEKNKNEGKTKDMMRISIDYRERG
jgi:hypothetical protein